MDKKMELLKKLQRLAEDDRGNDNERISAETMLNQLMLKWNISINDLELDTEKPREIEFYSLYEKKLIFQICYKLFKNNKSIRGYVSQRSKYKRTHLTIDMTDSEFIEFEYLYSTYRQDLQKEMDLFYSAFVAKNNIYPELTKEEQEEINKKPDEYTKNERLRIRIMAEGIEMSQIRKQIGGPDEQES